MTEIREPLEVVVGYYAACNSGGDLSDVPLADNVWFEGPLGRVEGADRFRAHTAERGDMRCSIREQFVKGGRVCSIVDWELKRPALSLTTTDDKILEYAPHRVVYERQAADSEEPSE